MADFLAEDPRLRGLGAALLLSIAGPAAGVVLLNLAAVALVAGGVGFDPTGPAGIVLSLVFVTGLGFGGVSLFYVRQRGVGWDYLPVRRPSLRDLLWVGGGYVLGLLGVFAMATIVIAVFGPLETTNQTVDVAMANPELYAVLIPASFLIIGPGEELLFRGVVQGRLREVFSAVPAIAIASAIFAIIHFVALTGGATDRILVLFILFVPALVLGAAYERTNNLLVPILIHGTYDATIFGLQYVLLKYAPEQLEGAAAILL